MKKSLTPKNILSDIEFELVQGAISQDELGEGIQAVRRYQNKLRSQAFRDTPQMDDREVMARLFQLNDMMITLLQETASTMNSLRLDLRKVARLSQHPSTADVSMPAMESIERERRDVVRIAGDLESELDEALYRQVGDAMRSETLQVEMDVRVPRIPIIGGVINRLRIALHDLVLFYVRRLARRQITVNQAYGDSILSLLEIYELQQEKIDALNERVASL
jgi:hypothetical protein